LRNILANFENDKFGYAANKELRERMFKILECAVLDQDLKKYFDRS